MGLETQAPHWEWYFIALYFFVGGVSAGAYFIGSLAEFFGGGRDREISRVAFYIAFPLILIAPPLLIGDLGQPLRFWHLFLNASTGLPVFNFWSPMSVGSWALMLYGAMTTLSFIDNLVASGRLKFAPFARVYNAIPRKLYAIVGTMTGFFVAGYTGVLLNMTARPLWQATNPLVGALFMASAGSTGAAAIYLVMALRRKLASAQMEEFEHFDRLAKVFELGLALALVLVAGQFAAPLMRGPYAIMFWVGALTLGTLLPLAMNWYATRPGAVLRHSGVFAVIMALFVLMGGALLRIALVQAGQV
jgi:protein NrfD